LIRDSGGDAEFVAAIDAFTTRMRVGLQRCEAANKAKLDAVGLTALDDKASTI